MTFAFGCVSQTMVITRTCHISNIRAHFSLSYDMNDIVKGMIKSESKFKTHLFTFIF